MRTKLFLSAFALLLVADANAQGNNVQPSVSGRAWADVFVGPSGLVLYPQYSWAVSGHFGTLSGYGFLEKAPPEPLFTNHLVVYCLPSSPLCARTETGGAPKEGTFHFQVGPQVNLHVLIPPLGKKMHHLVVSQLPGLVGARPPNTLVAMGTNRFRITSGIDASVEGYWRFLPGGRPDYSEWWVLVHPKRIKPVSMGAFAIRHGRITWAAGIRVAP